MTRLKQSRFNVFLDEGYKVIGANLLAESMVEMDKEKLGPVLEILENPNTASSNKSPELKSILTDNQFLVPEKLDEIAFLKVRSRIARHGNNGVGLTIAPTLDCNFRCPYCYEEREQSVMPEEILKSTIEFIKGVSEHRRQLRVNWFGGEPLLCLDIIERLSRDIEVFTEENGVEFIPSMTTNGYLLDEQTIRRLISLRIRDFQITIDGPREVHDRRRLLPNGKGSFDRIMKNVANLLPHISVLRLRVNIDRENQEHIPELVDVLSEKFGSLREKIRIGFYPVSVTGNYSDMNTCYRGADFQELIGKLYKHARKRGFFIASGFSLSGTVYCSAYQFNNYVIGPNGLVFKCVVDLGRNELAVGRIDDGALLFSYPFLLKWTAWEPFDDPECLACKALPICMGGCLKLHDTDVQGNRCAMMETLETRVRYAFNNPGIGVED